MNKIGVAVIGVGFWGKNHARVFDELSETQLLAVCDRNKKRVQTIAKQYGVDAYIESEELLKRGDIDAVSICTWTTTHAIEAIKALQAQKHVFVEKPLASSVEEAKEIVEFAKMENKHLMVGFIERFNPGVKRIKETLENGKIGELVSANAKRVSQWPERIGDVGVLKDYAIHDIDLMRKIFDDDPTTVYASIGNMKHKKYEDYAQIMLTFKGGKTAFIETNWLTPYKIRSLTLTGSEAILSLDYIKQEITIETFEKTIKPRHAWQEPLIIELQHYASSILHDKTPEVTGIDGLKALVIAETAIKSSQKGESMKISFDFKE